MSAPLRVGDAIASRNRGAFGVVLQIVPGQPPQGIVLFQNGIYARGEEEYLKALRDSLDREQAA